MYKSLNYLILMTLLLLTGNTVSAKGVYQSEVDFIKEAFTTTPPEASRLWLTKDERQGANEIMQRKMPLRVKHWYKDGQSVWILNEIGKEQPITTGIVVQQGKIIKLKVLIFRESRGWEVRYPFFTNQFNHATLQADKHSLDKNIDGITGATLSVHALKKLARLALYFDKVLSSKRNDS